MQKWTVTGSRSTSKHFCSRPYRAQSMFLITTRTLQGKPPVHSAHQDPIQGETLVERVWIYDPSLVRGTVMYKNKKQISECLSTRPEKGLPTPLVKQMRRCREDCCRSGILEPGPVVVCLSDSPWKCTNAVRDSRLTKKRPNMAPRA